jgi:hypothetical protein
MKMLFFSSDDSEVEQAGKELTTAGIPCQIRRDPLPQPPCTELWIQDNHDTHRALMLFAELGIGFSKRPVQTLLTDDDDFEIAAAAAAAA